MPGTAVALRRAASVLARWLTFALVSCSSDDPTLKETHSFVDAAGRGCEAILERTSKGAPVVFSSVSCDGAGRECSSDSEPCFQLSVLRDATELRNCPACCLGSSSSFSSSDCSAVVCETDADCVYERASCTEGLCICPEGRCE